MKPLCVLITNHALRDRCGSEMYVADLALRLLELGHRPVVYSPRLGAVAELLLHATIPVVDSLDQLGVAPDILHCHHSVATATALLRFPETPAIYVCHDWAWHHDAPPSMRRIRRLIAVDQTVAERLVLREGRQPEEVEVLSNGVDLRKFQLREGPLPARPRRALVFSNYMSSVEAGLLAATCARHGISLDAVGQAVGRPVDQPGELLSHYDLVFAKGRCAAEAIATGAAVIVCDTRGLGPMVGTSNLDYVQPRNFGRRLLGRPLVPALISAEIDRFDPEDARRTSLLLREAVDLDRIVSRLVELYREAISRTANEPSQDHRQELLQLSRLLAWCDRTQSLWRTDYEASRPAFAPLTFRRPAPPPDQYQPRRRAA